MFSKKDKDFNRILKNIQDQSDNRRRDLSKGYSNFLYNRFAESSNITFDDMATAKIGEKSSYPTSNSENILATRIDWEIQNELKFNAYFSAGAILSKHYHSDAEEVMEVDPDCEGFFIFSFKGKDHLLEAGEVIIIPAGVEHVVTYTAPRGEGKLTSIIRKIS